VRLQFSPQYLYIYTSQVILNVQYYSFRKMTIIGNIIYFGYFIPQWVKLGYKHNDCNSLNDQIRIQVTCTKYAFNNSRSQMLYHIKSKGLESVKWYNLRHIMKETTNSLRNQLIDNNIIQPPGVVVCRFLLVLWFPPPIKLAIVESGR
jgi:hypothetical protein